MPTTFVDNDLCSCRGNETCASCRFCGTHNTTAGRKSLCEKITHFLVFTPLYQAAVAEAVQMLFPDKIVYDDEKDIGNPSAVKGKLGREIKSGCTICGQVRHLSPRSLSR